MHTNFTDVRTIREPAKQMEYLLEGLGMCVSLVWLGHHRGLLRNEIHFCFFEPKICLATHQNCFLLHVFLFDSTNGIEQISNRLNNIYVFGSLQCHLRNTSCG